MSLREHFTARVQRWCEEAGWKPSYLGRRAVADNKTIVGYMAGTSEMTTMQYERILAFIESNPPDVIRANSKRGPKPKKATSAARNTAEGADQ